MIYIEKFGKCEACKQITIQVYYDDWRPGKPYAYYQCDSCGTCFYRCPVHKTWTGDRAIEDEEVCTCREKKI